MKGKVIKCDIEKYFFTQTKMEYLGLWITRYDVKLIHKKIAEINNMKPPTSQKEVRQFLGVVNYYRNMWARCSNTLAP